MRTETFFVHCSTEVKSDVTPSTLASLLLMTQGVINKSEVPDFSYEIGGFFLD